MQHVAARRRGEHGRHRPARLRSVQPQRHEAEGGPGAGAARAGQQRRRRRSAAGDPSAAACRRAPPRTARGSTTRPSRGRSASRARRWRRRAPGPPRAATAHGLGRSPRPRRGERRRAWSAPHSRSPRSESGRRGALRSAADWDRAGAARARVSGSAAPAEARAAGFRRGGRSGHEMRLPPHRGHLPPRRPMWSASADEEEGLAREPESWRAVLRRDKVVFPAGQRIQTGRCV